MYVNKSDVCIDSDVFFMKRTANVKSIFHVNLKYAYRRANVDNRHLIFLSISSKLTISLIPITNLVRKSIATFKIFSSFLFPSNIIVYLSSSSDSLPKMLAFLLFAHIWMCCIFCKLPASCSFLLLYTHTHTHTHTHTRARVSSLCRSRNYLFEREIRSKYERRNKKRLTAERISAVGVIQDVAW